MLNPTARLRLLQLVLRAGGGLLVLAFLAMLLPFDWMASTHAWLGLGELPRMPLVNYLTRSVAALYGFHGVLLFIIATDPAKYRTIVRYLVFMNIGLGLMLVAVDMHAGMPLWWTLAEGPWLVGVGLLIGVLNK